MNIYHFAVLFTTFDHLVMKRHKLISHLIKYPILEKFDVQ